MTLTLDEFFDRMDVHEDRVPLDELTAMIGELPLTVDDVREYANFNDDHYQRNLIRAGSGYEALIMCWKNGQKSPIHDHAGSSCGVRVIKGVATETVFDHDDAGHVHATRSNELREGGVCGSQDADTHEIANVQANGEDLITLHVYSPPLGEIGLYTLDGDKITKRLCTVTEFAGGRT